MDLVQVETSIKLIDSIASCTNSMVISIVDKGISKILAPSSLIGRLCPKTLYLPNKDSITSELPNRIRSVVILLVSSTKYASICL